MEQTQTGNQRAETDDLPCCVSGGERHSADSRQETPPLVHSFNHNSKDFQQHTQWWQLSTPESQRENVRLAFKSESDLSFA